MIVAATADCNRAFRSESGRHASSSNTCNRATYMDERRVMRNAQSQSSTTPNFGTVDNISQITSQSWANDYSSQIESAFAASYRPGVSINLSA